MTRLPHCPEAVPSARGAFASKARLLLPALLLGSSAAWAGAPGESGWYISGAGGWSSIEDATNSTTSTGGSAGCALELPGLGCLIPGDVTGGGGGTSEFLFDGGTAFSLAVGRQFRNGVRSDLSLDWLRNDIDAVRAADGTETGSDTDLDAVGLLLNLWYDFALGRNFMPYVGGGMGARWLELTGGNGGSVDDTVFGYQLGAGLGWALSDRLALSLDYRYMDGDDPQFKADDGATLDSEFQAQTIGVSARYLFIHHPPPDGDGDGVADRDDKCPSTPSGVAVDATGCPLDSDGDGVNDGDDRCPDTPRGTTVDARGCPLDSDGDGVTDDRDQCPDTKPGTRVDARGCALDGDGDGVDDAQDQCPDSAPGSQVLANGCEALELKGVQFETDSAQLRPEAIAILDEAVEGLRRSPDVAVEVQGHTDDVGAEAYNMKLSQRRADAVRAYLIEHGIAAERLTAKGYGEASPKVPNTDDESRAQNRRVVLQVRGN